MGWAERANPCSLTGKSARSAMDARLVRFAEFFETRPEFDAYCDRAGITDAERIYVESLLPARLRYAR